MSDINIRIGGDNSDLRSVLNDSEKQVTKSFGGMTSAANLTGQSMLKRLDIRAGVAAIAAAIGFDVRSIADTISRFITGMSRETQEALKQIAALSRANADATIANMRQMASEETKYQLLLKERAKIYQALAKGAPSEALPEPSWIAKLKAIPSVGGLPNPFYDKGAGIGEEGKAAGVADAEKQKTRLIELDGQIRDIEKEKTKEVEKQNAKLTDQAKLKTDVQHAAVDTLKSEKEITAELEKQLAILNEKTARESMGEQIMTSTLFAGGRAFGPSEDPRRIESASEAELKELIRRRMEDIRFVEQTKGTGATALVDSVSGYLIQGSIQDRLKTDINRAEFQLVQRGSMARDIAVGGVDQARRNFTGDPLSFDRLLQQNGLLQSSVNEQTAQLRKLNDRLSQPLRVIDSSPPSPFG